MLKSFDLLLVNIVDVTSEPNTNHIRPSNARNEEKKGKINFLWMMGVFLVLSRMQRTTNTAKDHGDQGKTSKEQSCSMQTNLRNSKHYPGPSSNSRVSQQFLDLLVKTPWLWQLHSLTNTYPSQYPEVTTMYVHVMMVEHPPCHSS